MNILNFKFNNNRTDVDIILSNNSYRKIGQNKQKAVGYCIIIDTKLYFEIESMLNSNIAESDNISDIKQYCI